ncbi:MAG: DNA ligase [Candidatus Westeberhardia cardiocondylae]|nr:DNA ligase [Candidatus Westeberhardia cardiocondylae]
MHSTKIKKHIIQLKKKIRYWEYLYYYKNKSKVSDDKYDKTIKELETLEKKYPKILDNNSPTKKIGKIRTNNTFQKVYHKSPMLSLNNTYTSEEIIKFDKKIKKKTNTTNNIQYCCELKIDGIGISLLYLHGKLIQASTRGDGTQGENVTKNILTIQDIPMYLKNFHITPQEIEIRGEIFIKNTQFTKFKKKNKKFSNPRNTASGSVRQLNHKITAQRPLNFFAYGVSMVQGEYFPSTNHYQQLCALKNLGIPINTKYIKIFNNIKHTIQYYKDIQKKKQSIDFNIDGIVIKVNSLTLQKKLHYNSRAPNWAIAYKFPTKNTITKIRDIKFQIGKSGILTPIAYIKPIIINGTIIQNINLYNTNIMKQLNIMIGDEVTIQKSGDIIPKIIKINKNNNNNHIPHKTTHFPTKCPSCNSNIQTNKKPFILRCNAGIKCKAQKKERLKHFVSKHAMNIHGIGKKTIDQLIDKKIIDTPQDLFQLNKNDLVNLKMLSNKSINNLLNSIEQAKKTTFARFLYALSIPHIGKNTSWQLAKIYQTIENIQNTNIHTLQNIPNIGKIAAKQIYNFFQNQNNIKIIKNLLDPKIGIYWKK